MSSPVPLQVLPAEAVELCSEAELSALLRLSPPAWGCPAQRGVGRPLGGERQSAPGISREPVAARYGLTCRAARGEGSGKGVSGLGRATGAYLHLGASHL